MLTKIKFAPGIDKQDTAVGAEGRWVDSDNVRFRYGLPEKVGGWQSLLNDSIVGVARKQHAFVDKEGKILGKHRGYPFYTIGQRRGLEIALGEPMYVTEIHPDTNTVTLGLVEDLLKTKMSVRGLNLVKYAELPESMEALVKVRYKHPGSKALMEQRNGELVVNFYEEVSAIAPGQSAVFYEGDDVIGGGFIKKDH